VELPDPQHEGRIVSTLIKLKAIFK